MGAYDNRIKQLIALAGNSSDVNRELVYRKLVSLLLDERIQDDRAELAALLRLMDALAPGVGIECRTEMARLVAGQADPPRELAEHMATDMASVAAPILKKVAFDEEALLRIIGVTSRAHHLLIAERADLTSRIWEALSRRPGMPAGGGSQHSRAIPQEPTVGAPARPRTAPEPGAAVAALDTPSRDLAALAESPQAPAFLLQDPQQGFRWATNRQGRISGLSPAARTAFGRSAESLSGLYFFTLLEPLRRPPGEQDFGTILTRHLPIRDLPVEIEDTRGVHQRWILTGRAGFDVASGRFTGYRGQATGGGEQATGGEQEIVSEPIESASPSAILIRRAASDARTPIAETLAAAMRLRKKIGALNDAELLGDLTNIIDGCYRMRDMAEDMENAVAGKRSEPVPPAQVFDLVDLMKECLREDILRRGGVSRFHLATGIEALPIRFNRQLAYQAMVRILQVVNARSKGMQGQRLTAAPASNGLIEMRVSLAEAGSGLLDDEILFSPTRYLRSAAGPALDDEAPMLPPEFGLSAVRVRIRSLGGRIYLGRDARGGRWLALGLPHDG